jgi:hypothetical protein
MFSSIYQLSKMSLFGQYIFSSNLPHLFALRKKLVYDCRFKASSERNSIWNKITLGKKTGTLWTRLKQRFLPWQPGLPDFSW